MNELNLIDAMNLLKILNSIDIKGSESEYFSGLKVKIMILKNHLEQDEIKMRFETMKDEKLEG